MLMRFNCLLNGLFQVIPNLSQLLKDVFSESIVELPNKEQIIPYMRLLSKRFQTEDNYHSLKGNLHYYILMGVFM